MKGKKLLLASAIEYSGLGKIIRLFRPPQLCIYNFHRIKSDDNHEAIFDDLIYGLTEREFENIIIKLKTWGVPVSGKDLIHHFEGQKTLQQNSFAITFDDAYVDFYLRSWPILKKHQVPAFLFVPTEAIEKRELGWWDRIAYILKKSPLKKWTWDGRTYHLEKDLLDLNGVLHRAYSQGNSFLSGDKLKSFSMALGVPSIPLDLQSKELLTWEQIQILHREGVTIGAHSHLHEIFSYLSKEEQRHDLSTCRGLLEENLNESPQFLAWPVGGYIHYSDESIKIAQELGYQYIFSFETGTNTISKLNQFNIKRVTGNSHPLIVMAEIAFPNLFSSYQSKESSHWPLTIAASLISLINFLIPVLMARFLLPNEVGIFRIFALYLAVFPSLTLIMGINNGLSMWGGQGDRGRAIIQSVGFFLLIYSVMLFSLLLIFYGILSPIFHVSNSLFTVFVFSISFYPMSGFFELASVATGTVVSTAFISIGFEILKSVLVTFVLWYFRSLGPVLWVYGGWIAMKTVITTYWSWKNGLIKLEWDFQRLRKAHEYAMPVSLAAIFSFLVNYSDKFLLTYFLSPMDFALYSIGCLSIPPLVAFECSLHNVLIPKLSKLFHEKGHFSNPLEAQRLYRKSIFDLAFFLFPSAVGLFVYSDPIISILFTERYQAASAFLKLFSISYIILCFPIDSIARAKGDSPWIFKNSIFVGVSAFLFIGGGLYFAGAIGALIGYLLGQLLFRYQGYRYLLKTEGWNIRQQIPGIQVMSISIASGLLGLTALSLKTLFTSETEWFLITGALFVMLYFMLIKKVEHAVNSFVSK